MTHFEEIDGDYADALLHAETADAMFAEEAFYYNEKGQSEARYCKDTVYGPKMLAPRFVPARGAA